MGNTGELVTTFSIVGYDPEAPAWGIAVASRFLAVGARACWGAPDGGVVVIQAHLNAGNGREGVALLREGVSAHEAIARLMAKDPHRALRQMAVIDREGNVATYTGERCLPWAGGIIGEHCAAQGNMLVSGEGCRAMVDHFVGARASLARRLVEALALGDEMGGDFRGRQAAALYVVRPPWADAYDVFTEPTIDLRVDDHPNPFAELARLLDLWELIYLPTSEEERMSLDESGIRRYQDVLIRLGYLEGEASGQLDEPTRGALQMLARMQNFRRRIAEGGHLDRRLLEYLEQTSAA